MLQIEFREELSGGGSIVVGFVEHSRAPPAPPSPLVSPVLLQIIYQTAIPLATKPDLTHNTLGYPAPFCSPSMATWPPQPASQRESPIAQLAVHCSAHEVTAGQLAS